MAAYGSGAVARSIREQAVVMNVDVGGGTSKIAICADGKVVDLTAIDVGARLVCFDASGRISGLEEAGRRFGAELRIDLALGEMLKPESARALAAMHGGSLVRGHARLRTKRGRRKTSEARYVGAACADGSDHVLGWRFEFIYGREAGAFNDLGPLLAQRNPRAYCELLPTAGAFERRYPCDRDRRFAVHDQLSGSTFTCRRSTRCRCEIFR
jgi:ethanolamine utilization protein EutA